MRTGAPVPINGELCLNLAETGSMPMCGGMGRIHKQPRANNRVLFP